MAAALFPEVTLSKNELMIYEMLQQPKTEASKQL